MNKKTIIIFAVLLSFILLITSTMLFISAQQKINRSERNIDVTTIDLYTIDELKEQILDKPEKSNLLFYLIPISAFFGLFVGLLIYYLLSDEITKKDKNINIKNKTILNLLSDHEKKIIEKILENDGKIRQYELTYIEGISKVKVHRLILKLEENGIIKKEKIGKVNNLVLDKDIYYMLKN
jgi:DNA-binding transcriptional ArsR family regulator